MWGYSDFLSQAWGGIFMANQVSAEVIPTLLIGCFWYLMMLRCGTHDFYSQSKAT
jgi:hypothetical protein